MVKNVSKEHYLDLRGYVCPVNFVKCCLALESLACDEVLKVDVDIGEAEISVIEGLQEKGYQVNILKKNAQMISLLIASASK